MDPANNRLEVERIAVLLRYGTWGGLVAHILFLLLFLVLGSYLLAAFNILSIGIFAICIMLAMRGKIIATILLAAVEITAHAWLATWVLGWNSGFHYYLITLTMLSGFNPYWSVRGKLGFGALVCLVYLMLDQWSIGLEPALKVGEITLVLLRWFNIASTFGFVGYLAYFFAETAHDAEMNLERLATTDTLTGLFNRRFVNELFKIEHAKLLRYKRPMSVIMIDIDNFKMLNDKFGHECGDDALKTIADCFRKTVRRQDYVARWGGEEFLVLLPETSLSGANTLAEKIRARVSSTPITSRNQTHFITITSAVGEYHPGEDFDSLLLRVDNGLLAGKRAGKNQVVMVEAGIK